MGCPGPPIIDVMDNDRPSVFPLNLEILSAKNFCGFQHDLFYEASDDPQSETLPTPTLPLPLKGREIDKKIFLPLQGGG